MDWKVEIDELKWCVYLLTFSWDNFVAQRVICCSLQYKNITLLIRSDHYLFEGTCSLWIELQFCMVICNYWHHVMERYFFTFIKTKSTVKNIYQKVFLHLPSATRAPLIEICWLCLWDDSLPVYNLQRLHYLGDKLLQIVASSWHMDNGMY